MLKKESGTMGMVRVLFLLPNFCAKTIFLVGDFNEWNPGVTPLCASEQGWFVEIELPVGNVYRYRFLVNETRWLNDWQADYYAPNICGGDDSVVVTLLPHEMEGVEVICPYDGKPCLIARSFPSSPNHSQCPRKKPRLRS